MCRYPIRLRNYNHGIRTMSSITIKVQRLKARMCVLCKRGCQKSTGGAWNMTLQSHNPTTIHSLHSHWSGPSPTTNAFSESSKNTSSRLSANFKVLECGRWYRGWIQNRYKENTTDNSFFPDLVEIQCPVFPTLPATWSKEQSAAILQNRFVLKYRRQSAGTNLCRCVPVQVLYQVR